MWKPMINLLRHYDMPIFADYKQYKINLEWYKGNLFIKEN